MTLKPEGGSGHSRDSPEEPDDTELRIPGMKGTPWVLKARSNLETKERGDQEGTQLKGGTKKTRHIQQDGGCLMS